jgi:hypothetical protein
MYLNCATLNIILLPGTVGTDAVVFSFTQDLMSNMRYYVSYLRQKIKV